MANSALDRLAHHVHHIIAEGNSLVPILPASHRNISLNCYTDNVGNNGVTH